MRHSKGRPRPALFSVERVREDDFAPHDGA
jgi:hypothetical protein